MTNDLRRPEPNFFVVGAARAGTTSIWQFLRQHPDVQMPSTLKTKEPSYFAEYNPTWAPKFPDRDAYLELFKNAGEKKAIGEASPAYMLAPSCARRIFSAYPGARIIITLRQPARRAFSLYRLMCTWGLEWLPTFERALDAEDARAADFEFQRRQPFWFPLYLYFRVSLYASQVKQYLDVFPRPQIHVVLFEDLKRRPVETTQEIFRFLGVDPTFEPAVKTHNESFMPASTRVQHMLADRWRMHPLFAGRRPAGQRQSFVHRKMIPILFGCNLLAGRWLKNTLDPGTERRLLERYRSDIELTGTLIGRDLGLWLEPPQDPGRAA